MAYANWLNPSKTQGSGNDTVSVGALTDNTGCGLVFGALTGFIR